MKQNEIQSIIETTAEKTANSVILGLKKEKFLKTGRTPYAKVETLLYSYTEIKELIRQKREEIKHLRQNGLDKKSKDIAQYTSGGAIDNRSESEKVEDKIKELENSIALTKHYIKTINKALKTIENDKYYEIITKYYFEKISVDKLSAHFGKDIKTIYRNRQRLVNKLKLQLFTDETIVEMMR